MFNFIDNHDFRTVTFQLEVYLIVIPELDGCSNLFGKNFNFLADYFYGSKDDRNGTNCSSSIRIAMGID